MIDICAFQPLPILKPMQKHFPSNRTLTEHRKCRSTASDPLHCLDKHPFGDIEIAFSSYRVYSTALLKIRLLRQIITPHTAKC